MMNQIHRDKFCIKKEPGMQTYEIKDKLFEEMIDLGATVEKVADQFLFTEGPVWIQQTQSLLFSDIPANRMYQWSAKPGESSSGNGQGRALQGSLSVFRDPSGYSNGHTLDKKGRLISCEHKTRRVSRTQKDGSQEVLADNYEGQKFNSPNDVVVHSSGMIYFTDPPYGIQPEEAELDFSGLFRLDPESKNLELLSKELRRPNGLVFSPDEKILYVAESEDPRHVWAFDVRADGTLDNCRPFITPPDGVPDGIRIDAQGRLFSTGGKGVYVYDPTGKHLGTILCPESPANCAFGGVHGKSLFMTARTSIYKIDLEVSGFPVGPLERVS